MLNFLKTFDENALKRVLPKYLGYIQAQHVLHPLIFSVILFLICLLQNHFIESIQKLDCNSLPYKLLCVVKHIKDRSIFQITRININHNLNSFGVNIF